MNESQTQNINQRQIMAKKEEPPLSLAAPEAATSAAESAWVHWTSARADAGIDYITGVKEGATYEVRARYINVLGVHGPWTYATCRVEGPGAPEAPTALEMTANPADLADVPPVYYSHDSIDPEIRGKKMAVGKIRWTKSASTDVAFYELIPSEDSPFMNGAYPPNGTEPVGFTTHRTNGMECVWIASRVKTGPCRRWWVRAVSRSGIPSAWQGPVNVAETLAYGPA